MIVRSLIWSCVFAIPVLIAMGLLPVLVGENPNSSYTLAFYNWGFLGASGSMTAVLLSLRNSDVAEVGSTEGRRELWRTVIGCVLGLVAGILVYAVFAGKLISDGRLVPQIEAATLEDVGLTIFVAVAAGFGFERVFDQLRSATPSGPGVGN